MLILYQVKHSNCQFNSKPTKLFKLENYFHFSTDIYNFCNFVIFHFNKNFRQELKQNLNSLLGITNKVISAYSHTNLFHVVK